jgi:hypothetical protein
VSATERSEPLNPPIFAFLHVPKTAGSTLAGIVYNEYQDGSGVSLHNGGIASGVLYTDKFSYPEGFFTTESRPVHATLPPLDDVVIKAVIGHFSYGIHEIFDGPVAYFSMVRDPIERALSFVSHMREYRYEWLSGQERYQPVLELAGSDGDGFVEIAKRHGLLELSNDQTRRMAGNALPFGIEEFDTEDELLESTLDRFDFVGLTEKFDESLVLARHHFSWSPVKGYLAKLVSPQRVKATELSVTEVAELRRLNRLDIKLYEKVRRRFDTLLAEAPQALHEEIGALKCAVAGVRG